MLFPKTATAREIQRNYRKVFDDVKKSKETVFIMKNNKPEVAIVDVDRLSNLEATIEVLQSREEARTGKAKVLKGSFEDLWNETQNS